MWLLNHRKLKAIGLSAAILCGLFAPYCVGLAATPSKAQKAQTESMRKLLQQANDAANRQDYPEAIGLYEQASLRSPNDKTIKNNLAVLYANYGVFLQEQQDYAGAQQYYDKALRLTAPQSQDARTVLNSKAGAYYAESLAMRSPANLPPGAPAAASSADNYARRKELIQRAMTLAPDEQAFRRGMANVYVDEAYDLATRERYSEAAPLLEQAMAYDTESPSIRQSLANVYLGLARNDAAHRQEWLNKAMALDNSPQTRQAIDRMNAPPVIVPAPAKPTTPASKTKSQTSTPKRSFANPPSGLTVRPPADLSRLSVLDMLRDMENLLGLTPAENATLQQRLEGVEAPVLGSVQTGPVAVRAKAAYVALMGTAQPPRPNQDEASAQTASLPLSTPENSYLDQIFKVTDGKVVRWGKFPLRVYIEEPKDNALYKPELKAAALAGMDVWKTATNGFTNFIEVKNPDASDVQIHWTGDAYVDRFIDSGKQTERYKNYVPPHYSHAMRALQVASMVTPGYFSLAPQALNAAMQYKEAKKLDVLKDESVMTLGLAGTRDLTPEAARIMVQNMAAQEFGHALGLKGHSATPGDLMYPELSSSALQTPSARDLETLRALYDRPANIVLNIR